MTQQERFNRAKQEAEVLGLDIKNLSGGGALIGSKSGSIIAATIEELEAYICGWQHHIRSSDGIEYVQSDLC